MKKASVGAICTSNLHILRTPLITATNSLVFYPHSPPYQYKCIYYTVTYMYTHIHAYAYTSTYTSTHVHTCTHIQLTIIVAHIQHAATSNALHSVTQRFLNGGGTLPHRLGKQRTATTAEQLLATQICNRYTKWLTPFITTRNEDQ